MCELALMPWAVRVFGGWHRLARPSTKDTHTLANIAAKRGGRECTFFLQRMVIAL